MIEIHCPPGCAYLSSSREHPAAIVRRRQERDLEVLLPALSRLTERQHQLFFLFQSAIAGHQPAGFAKLADDDVADAAGAMAATLETASRGVLYEHTPASTSARQLVSEMTGLLAAIEKEIGKPVQREVIPVLRAIETGAREARKSAEGGETAYLRLVGRLLQAGETGDHSGAPGRATAGPTQAPAGRRPLIIP